MRLADRLPMTLKVNSRRTLTKMNMQTLMNLDLQVFRSVAHHLSFTKASQELYISQPAISKHIQKLEAAYHVRLFDRLGNRISLTQAGRLLLKHSDVLAADYQRLDFEMNRLRQRVSGGIRIGASTTISQYELPQMLASFLKAYPQTDVSVISGNSREVEAALMDGKVDVGLVEGIVRQPPCRYSLLMKDELVAIVRAGHPLAQRGSVAVGDLSVQPLVLREMGSGTLDVFERELKKHRLTLADMNVQINLGSTESIKRFILHSNCMGIVSIRAVRKEVLEGELKVLEIEGMKLERDFVFVEKHGESGQLVNVFKRFVTSECKG